MLPVSEACERNKGPILDVLRTCLAGRSHVLEIGSGTGQHAVYFSAHLPDVVWHPTERQEYLADLVARVQQEGSANLLAPAVLDVCQPVWPVGDVDAIFTANTLHIMSWIDVQCLFRGVARVLSPGGVLCIYGPFRYAGAYTSASNGDFDRMLQSRDPLSGIRDITDVVSLASAADLELTDDRNLPAFNRLLILLKRQPAANRQPS